MLRMQAEKKDEDAGEPGPILKDGFIQAQRGRAGRLCLFFFHLPDGNRRGNISLQTLDLSIASQFTLPITIHAEDRTMSRKGNNHP